LGCGDGIFSFIRAGGQFGITFDAFQSVTNLDSFFDKVDIFNSFDENLSPDIVKKSNYQIDYAFDHKENLCKKAKTLGLYRHFKIGNANERLPFEDNMFYSVFSNMVYWLDDPEFIFSELARILKPEDRCCLMLPNKTFPDFSFYYNLFIKQKDVKFQFLEKLDRGRITDNIKHAKSTDEWTKIIEKSGLQVVKHSMHLSRAPLRTQPVYIQQMFQVLVHIQTPVCIIIEKSGLQVVKHSMHLSRATVQIWDVGLRPIFPVLYKMVSGLNKETIVEIKKQWVETFLMFLAPIVELDNTLNSDVEPGFHCLFLKK